MLSGKEIKEEMQPPGFEPGFRDWQPHVLVSAVPMKRWRLIQDKNGRRLQTIRPKPRRDKTSGLRLHLFERIIAQRKVKTIAVPYAKNKKALAGTATHSPSALAGATHPFPTR